MSNVVVPLMLSLQAGISHRVVIGGTHQNEDEQQQQQLDHHHSLSTSE